MKNSTGVLEKWGLHPLVAAAAIAVDAMLFAEETATFLVGWAISIPVAAILGMGSVFVQKKAFGDGWMAALGKGLIIAVLTAIPTPLPSLVTMSTGVLGAIGMWRSQKKNRELEE